MGLAGASQARCTERLASFDAQHEVSSQLDTTSAATLAQSHIVNVGKLVEDMELKMRNLLQEVYFSSTLRFPSCWGLSLQLLSLFRPSELTPLRWWCVFAETKDILGSLRSQAGLNEQNKFRAVQGELVGLLKGRKVAT